MNVKYTPKTKDLRCILIQTNMHIFIQLKGKKSNIPVTGTSVHIIFEGVRSASPDGRLSRQRRASPVCPP